MEFKKNRYNPYGTEQDELPQSLSDMRAPAVYDAHVTAYAALADAAPEENFDAERIQRISTGTHIETQAGLIIHNDDSRLEIAEFNWFGYNSKTLLVGEKSTIAFSLGAQGMSEFSFDYFALHNTTTVINFYDVNGKLIGAEKLYYTGSVSAKKFDIKTLNFIAPPGVLIARAELVTGDEPSVGDYGFHIDNVKWIPAGPLPVEFSLIRMDKDSGINTTDFITNDGSAGRQVEGTLSRVLSSSETLQFWDGTKWVNATVTGLNWQAQDNTAHGADWEYKLRVINAAGHQTPEQAFQITYDITPSDVLVIFDHMDKDDGVAGDWQTTNGSAGRTVFGTLSKALSDGDVIEYSLDGGLTWQKLTVNGLSWSFIDDGVHATDWQYQTRIIDIAGNVTVPVVQDVVLLPGPVSLTFDRMDKDTGASDSDFITKDGTAGRLVEGTLSRALNPGESLVFWDGSKWIAATVNGLNWQAQDNVEHTADWTYKLRVVDSSGSTVQDAHQKVVLTPPPNMQIIFERMDKDDGVAGDWRTTDGSAGRTVYGTLSKALSYGDLIEYSLDGGTSWQTLSVIDLNWSFPDPLEHTADWEYQIRITDIAGNISSPVVRHATLESLLGEVTIDAVGKDSGFSAYSADAITRDGAAGRLIHGSLSEPLKDGEKVQVSFDNGLTWHDAQHDGNKWFAIDNSEHTTDWVIKARAANVSGYGKEVQQTVLYAANSVPAPGIAWNGKALTATLSPMAKVGEKIQFLIDGKSVVVNLTTADATAQKVTLPWTVAAQDFRASYIDIAGNNSDWTVLKPTEMRVGLETFNSQAARTIYAGSIFQFNSFILTAVKISNYGYINRFGSTNQGGIGSPPKSMALEMSNGSGGTEYRIDLKNQLPVNKISFTVGDLNTSERIEAVFYDSTGRQVFSDYRTGSSGLTQLINFSLPYGQTFSSVVLKLNSYNSYVWIDDVDLRNISYNGPTYTESPSRLQSINQSTLYIGSDTDDVFQLSNASHLNSNDFFLRGQDGIDTLQLTGRNINLDLTALGGKIQSIEMINLTGSGDNTLSLSLGDVIQQGGIDLFNMSGNVQMAIKGNAGDKVNLSDLLPDNGDVGNWSSSGNITVGGVVYAVWQHSTLDAELLVQNGVAVNPINH
jgi:hypothetical protein